MNRVSKTKPNQNLDLIVDQFEESWNQFGAADIRNFLPPLEHSNHAEILCELIRLDLEIRWRKNEQPRVEDYLTRFADSNLTKSEIKQLAFEEYRVRFQAGQSVTSTEYSQRFEIDTSKWPTWSSSENPRAAKTEPVSNGKHCLKQERKTRLSLIAFPDIGSRFHGFEIVGLLGQGAFGRVFLARQEDLANRFVALKVTEVSEVEPQCLARLQHTNIIPIYSLKKANDLQSICMPFLGVATMRDLFLQADQKDSLSRSGKELISTVAGHRASTIGETVASTPNPELEAVLNRQSVHGESMSAIAGLNYQDTALWMVGRVADGLAYAHSRDIVHGDLKPGNVLISDDGEPLILDFHVSRAGKNITSDTLVGGTLPYMSARHLESLQGSNAVDPSCDLFSLGVVLYESLTGVLPYQNHGVDDLAIGQMIRDRQRLPVSIRQHNPESSTDVNSIVEHCLSPVPGHQYSSARELQTDIERHLLNLPLRFAPNRSLTERAKKWIKRHPRLSSATSIAVFALIATGIAVALIAGKLATATRIKMENESIRFVENVVDTRVPLMMKQDNNTTIGTTMDRVREILQSRTTGSTGEYNKQLARLPLEIRDHELREVSYTKYWIAYRLLNGANSQPAGPEKSRLLDQAIQELDFVSDIAHEKTPIPILQLKADVLASQGHVDRADQLRKSILPSQKTPTIKHRLLQATELARNNHDQEAIAVLKKLTGEQPEIIPAWMIMGRAYSRLKEYDKAELCFSTLIEMNQDAAWGYFQRGINYLRQRDFESARQDFDSAIEREPGNAASYLNRALAFRGLRQLEAAINDLTMAIEKGAIETRAYYLRHQIHSQLGETNRANQDLAKFLELEPLDEISWLSRGMAQMKINRPDLALADFETALKLNPVSIDAFQNIATVQSEVLDQTNQAVESLTQIIQLEPDNQVARVTRGVLHARIGNREQAHGDANSVLKRNSSADTLFRAAGVFALTSRQEKQDAILAIDLLNKAAFKDPRLVWSRILTDSDLKPLHEMDDYKKLLIALKQLSDGSRAKNR